MIRNDSEVEDPNSAMELRNVAEWEWYLKRMVPIAVVVAVELVVR